MSNGDAGSKDIQPGQMRAEDALVAEISKPVAERNVEFIDALNGAIQAQNELAFHLAELGKASGLEPSGLVPKAIVDSEGNFKGFAAGTSGKK